MIGPPTLVDLEDQLDEETLFAERAQYDGFLQQSKRVRSSTLEPMPLMNRPALVASRSSFNKKSDSNMGDQESHSATPNPSMMGQTLTNMMG